MSGNRTRSIDPAHTPNEFSDPRLVAIYDTVNPIAGYEAFYLELAARLSAGSVVDVGCGTGLLTFELAKRGHDVVGVEPAPAMLDAAKRRPYDREVRWIEGDATKVGDLQADLAIMTGHVAQFFLDDGEWRAALAALHGALRPGGHLAFESRNPLVQPWTDGGITSHPDWPSRAAPRRVEDPAAGPVVWWTELTGADGNRLSYEIHYRFARSGEELLSAGELVFRSWEVLERSLAATGFSVDAVLGDWDGRPADAGSPEMIFVAIRG